MSVSHDSHHTPDLKVTMERFQGGKSLMTLGAGVGLVGGAATLFAMFTGSVAAQYSSLFAFAYWAGISLTALFIPASRLCHQTMGILARAAELKGIPTMVISVDKLATERVRPPRTAYYAGELGATAGKPNWKQYQLRVLDEAIRWIETFDQPGSRKLVVDLETETEESRGER